MDSQVGRIWKLKHQKKTFFRESWLESSWGENFWIDLEKESKWGKILEKGKKNKEKKIA